MKVKSLFKSKTFWVNALTVVGSIASGGCGVTLDPKLALPALAIVNIGLRTITNGPVSVLNEEVAEEAAEKK